MTQGSPSSLFARIMTVIMVLACLGAAFWVGSQVLEPIAVPPPPPPKTQVRFDPKVDVSQSAMFQRLEPLGPAVVEAGTLGRVNPFAPVAPPVFATSTATTTAPVFVPAPLPAPPTSTEPLPGQPI